MLLGAELPLHSCVELEPHANPILTQNVTAFGHRVFKEAISLK